MQCNYTISVLSCVIFYSHVLNQVIHAKFLFIMETDFALGFQNKNDRISFDTKKCNQVDQVKHDQDTHHTLSK